MREARDIVRNTCSHAEHSGVVVGNVVDAMGRIEHATQKNAAVVEEMNAAAAGLTQEALTLAQLLSRFRTDGRGVQAHVSHPEASSWHADGSRSRVPTARAV
ncbi:MAG TPA: hypothetical protein VN112_15685 [Ensifer sp.]|nr:hypothetical protein [Ensifer sp.]